MYTNHGIHSCKCFKRAVMVCKIPKAQGQKRISANDLIQIVEEDTAMEILTDRSKGDQ
jgi:hypothetical protein